MLCCMLNVWFHQPCAWGSVFSFFLYFTPTHCRKLTKFGLFPAYYRRGNSENFGSVCLMVCEKIGLQTDRHGKYISIFFPMKKALRITTTIYFHNLKNTGLLNWEHTTIKQVFTQYVRNTVTPNSFYSILNFSNVYILYFRNIYSRC